METGFFSTLEKARTQVNDCTAGILEFVKEDDLKANYLKQMEDVLVSMVSCEHKVAVVRQSVKEATDRALDESTGQPSAALFDDLVEESIGELQQDSPLLQAVAQASSLKLFKQLVETHNAAAADEEDENESQELVATQVGPSFIDPISKKRMTDPVRNKHCRHVYDRASVTSMIASKSRHVFRCPEVGCGNRKAIKLSDLEDAPDVKRQLALG